MIDTSSLKTKVKKEVFICEGKVAPGTKNIVISHSSLDGDLAQKLAGVIRKCSLRLISVWHSSDNGPGAGLSPGQRWFDTIRSNLLGSNAVILLMTPNSKNSSWVQFEAGFGAGVSDLEIMPLILGVDIYDVPNPLSQWQIYKLSSADFMLTFLRKLFARLDVHFDDDLFSGIVSDFVKDCNLLTFETGSSDARTIDSDRDDLRNYLDKKFFDVHQRIIGAGGEKERGTENFSGYLLSIRNEMAEDGFDRHIRVEIDPGDTCQDVLNRVYFKISSRVKPWTYLSSWILRDVATGQKLVFREIGDEIPAHLIFRIDRELEVVALESPYSGTDSVGVNEPDFNLGNL